MKIVLTKKNRQAFICNFVWATTSICVSIPVWDSVHDIIWDNLWASAWDSYCRYC